MPELHDPILSLALGMREEKLRVILEGAFDSILRSNLDDVSNLVKTQDWDWLDINSGIERTGKSDFALWKAMYFSYRGHPFDWSPAMKHVIFRSPSISAQMMTVPDGSVIILDEGAEFLFSRESMKRGNVDTVKTLLAIGVKHLIVIVNMPDWHWLDKTVREHRVKSLFRVRSRGRFVSRDGRAFAVRERGLYRAYCRPQVVFSTKHKKALGDPSFFGRFPAFKLSFPDEWRNYEAKKIGYLKDKKNVYLDKEDARLERESGIEVLAKPDFSKVFKVTTVEK